MFTTLTQFHMADKTKTKTIVNPAALQWHRVIPEAKTTWWVLSAVGIPLPWAQDNKKNEEPPLRKTDYLHWDHSSALGSAPFSSTQSQLYYPESWEGMGSSGRGTQMQCWSWLLSWGRQGTKLYTSGAEPHFPWAHAPSNYVGGTE